MPNYRRSRVAGGTYFFTVVTAGRQPVLCGPPVRVALRRAIEQVRTTMPFEILAWVLLHDHLHCLWRLPPGDDDYPARWSLIKGKTTRMLAWPDTATPSRLRRRDGGLWQRRFWEHTVRDDLDLKRHVDYVHWNPVRHGLVNEAAEWPYSTFHRYCRRGIYPVGWDGGVSDDAVGTVGE